MGKDGKDPRRPRHSRKPSVIPAHAGIQSKAKHADPLPHLRTTMPTDANHPHHHPRFPRARE